MPASSTDVSRAPARVAPSAPLELMWLIHWAGASHSHGGEFGHMEELRRRRGPELEKVWGERLAPYSTEMLVLAHRSGTMLDGDLRRFFGRIDAAIDDDSVPS